MPTFSSVLQFGLTGVAIALALLTGYLVVLTIAAVFASKHGPAPGRGQRRFAVLVPAHNEEVLIGRLLHSLALLDYPRERLDICVVADNCSDSTAAIAREA